jgi:hypothetical protein
MVFVEGGLMFLTSPTSEELRAADLPDLIEMLVKHTSDYHHELHTEGITPKSLATKELLRNIQDAIESKKDIHNKTSYL